MTNQQRKYLVPVVIVRSLFFTWGFIIVLVDALIPRLRDVFTLSYFQAGQVQVAFFGAYFLVLLPGDLETRWRSSLPEFQAVEGRGIRPARREVFQALQRRGSPPAVQQIHDGRRSACSRGGEIMNRFLVYGIIGLSFLGCEVGHAGAMARPAAERPNVLFIVADDLNVDLACYGHPVVKTPNIDRLRERGMVFERAYSQYPLCNPSRNSFLTGLYPGTSGCLSNNMNIRDAVPDVVTLPQLFKANGYRAITTGKIYHQKDPVSWSRISNVRTGGLLPTDRDPAYYLKGWSDERKTRGEGRMLADDTVKWFEWRSVTEGEDLLKDGRTARATINRIDEIAEDGVPFFLAAGFFRPHDPYFAPKRFFDLYPLESLALPVAPDDASAIPDHAFYDVFKKAFDSMDEPAKREAMRAYYAGISYMDEQLGRVMEHMETKGLLENTVIVFMGDHGYQVGEKNYFNKGVLFERSCRAPLIIATPGMKQAGGSCSRVVEFVDIYPTLTELCGLENPAGLDGASLVPMLGNPTAACKEVAYTYCNADRSVRDPRFRYIVWKQGGHALYDHSKDPGEHYNLADNPEYSPVVKRLKAEIDAMPEPAAEKK